MFVLEFVSQVPTNHIIINNAQNVNNDLQNVNNDLQRIVMRFSFNVNDNSKQ